MFNLLAHTYPYDDVVRGYNQAPDSIFPRPAIIMD
jgi:hypothetical protein